jgi:ketosteroid isomerase-like protein
VPIFGVLTYRNASGSAFGSFAGMSEGKRAHLEALYRALRTASIDVIVDALDDDVEYISYAPSKVFPYLGHHRGKDNVAGSLREIFKEYEFLTYEPIFMVIEGDGAAVMIFARAYHRASRHTIQIMIAHFVRFRGNRIVEVREFMDSFDAVQQLLGHELSLPAA